LAVGFAGAFCGAAAGFCVLVAGGVAGIFMPGMLWPACFIESAVAAESRWAFVFAGVWAVRYDGSAATAATMIAAATMPRALRFNWCI
jgi:hypothetical protein